MQSSIRRYSYVCRSRPDTGGSVLELALDLGNTIRQELGDGILWFNHGKRCNKLTKCPDGVRFGVRGRVIVD